MPLERIGGGQPEPGRPLQLLSVKERTRGQMLEVGRWLAPGSHCSYFSTKERSHLLIERTGQRVREKRSVQHGIDVFYQVMQKVPVGAGEKNPLRHKQENVTSRTSSSV